MLQREHPFRQDWFVNAEGSLHYPDVLALTKDMYHP